MKKVIMQSRVYETSEAGRPAWMQHVRYKAKQKGPYFPQISGYSVNDEMG